MERKTEEQMDDWYKELDTSKLNELEIWALSIDNTSLMRKADEYVATYRESYIIQEYRK